MRGELPSQEQTTCSGNSRCSSVCRLARIEWNNRSQPETPARRSSRVISVRRFEFFQPIAVLASARYCRAATTYSLLSPKSREPRNTRKDDIAVEEFISVCSVCSVVKKNGLCSSLKDGTGNADVPRAALRFALGYLILPLWGGDITTLSCGDSPRFLATEWNNRGQPETPARRRSLVISVRRFEFFQPIAVLAAARYWGAATTYSLLSPKISNASLCIGRCSGKIGQLRTPRPS